MRTDTLPSTQLAACTVVTADYLPWVRVTAASFIEHHPAAKFAVLVMDEPTPHQLREEDCFTVARPADVGLSEPELGWMNLIYTPLELCCALKPWLLRRVLDTSETVFYIDADMCVYGSLADVAEEARQTGLVLSPHSLAPRDDPRMPDDDALLQFGQFNGGFIAVGAAGRPFIDWWASKCQRECTDWNPDLPRRYLDQRWLDLAIGYFPNSVTRDPGINLARWNLFQRDLKRVDGQYEVDGGPLRCFHFSAFDPTNPELIWRDGYTHPKVDPAQSPALRMLLAEYADRLLNAGWQPSTAGASPPLRYGLNLSAPVKNAIRAALITAERAAAAPSELPVSSDRLRTWLCSDSIAVDLPWYLLGLWLTRADVRGSFQHVPGADLVRYAAWAQADGVKLGLVPAGLLGVAQASAASAASAVATPPPVAAAVAMTPPRVAVAAPPQISQELLGFTAECRFERQSILDFAVRVARELPAGSRLLDVGAGNSPYRELFGHLQYESSDWQHSPHPGARTVDHIGPAHALPVADDEYDGILLTQVLEHVPNPAAVLQELHRVLRPGGHLYLTVPLVWELHEMPFDFFRYTPSGLAEMLTLAGFEHADVRPRNDCFETLAQLLRNVPTMVTAYPDGRNRERQVAIETTRALADRVAQFSGLDSRGIFPLGYSAAARKPDSTHPASAERSNQAQRAAVGLSEARGFITLCFAADIFADPRLLKAYAQRFSDCDDATLAIYAPRTDVAEAAQALRSLVTSVGLDGPASPDMVGLPFSSQIDERRLAAVTDAVLSLTPPHGAFAGLPWAHAGTLDAIRATLAPTG